MEASSSDGSEDAEESEQDEEEEKEEVEEAWALELDRRPWASALAAAGQQALSASWGASELPLLEVLVAASGAAAKLEGRKELRL
mmetsp:Transcript_77208/g.168827  ORF Transcript_77208/g.168827 Transcript_77208/m.168827 type:complete len:85 (-) Transcript_77208:531-785(-)